MNPTSKSVLNLLELLWKAAESDADEFLDSGKNQEAALSIIRMETIADVIDAVKNLAGEGTDG